jgi:hypothetical protein
MSNAIQFLESLGTRPIFASIDNDAYLSEVASIPVDPVQRQALLARDHLALSEQLGGRAQMMMQIWAPDESPQDDDQEPAEQPDDAPDDEPEDQLAPQDSR